MWSLDHFEATDQQLLLWTDPCSGATLAYNAALKSHWMETFIFKYWPQSWGRCEFSRQCPALAVCAGTGELYWENKEEFVCGSLYKTTKLESLCTLPMKIFSCLTTNRDSLKKKISILDSCYLTLGFESDSCMCLGNSVNPRLKLVRELAGSHAWLSANACHELEKWRKNWGKGSTQSVLSCSSAWVGVNLFCLWQLKQRIHGFISCWLPIWTYHSTLSLF